LMNCYPNTLYSAGMMAYRESAKSRRYRSNLRSNLTCRN
jgi:hypothetical protein